MKSIEQKEAGKKLVRHKKKDNNKFKNNNESNFEKKEAEKIIEFKKKENNQFNNINESNLEKKETERIIEFIKKDTSQFNNNNKSNFEKKESKNIIEFKKKDNNQFNNNNESNFIMKTLEDDLAKIIKEINLFKLLYTEYEEEDETIKFDKTKELLNECKEIFKDIKCRNKNILEKWQNKFKNDGGIEDELRKLKDFYKIEDKEDFNEIAKNILICVKKNIYYSDIKCLLYFIALFKSNETELTKYLKEKQYEFEDKEHFNFDKLVNISKYLEKKKIYKNNGKND
jgi:hypothetical protein